MCGWTVWVGCAHLRFEVTEISVTRLSPQAPVSCSPVLTLTVVAASGLKRGAGGLGGIGGPGATEAVAVNPKPPYETSSLCQVTVSQPVVDSMGGGSAGLRPRRRSMRASGRGASPSKTAKKRGGQLGVSFYSGAESSRSSCLSRCGWLMRWTLREPQRAAYETADLIPDKSYQAS